MKVLILGTMCLLEPKLHLSLFRAKRHSPCAFCEGASAIWGMVELGGRVCYKVKFLHIRHNLFAGASTLTLPFTRQSTFEVCGEGVSHLGEEI